MTDLYLQLRGSNPEDLIRDVIGSLSYRPGVTLRLYESSARAFSPSALMFEIGLRTTPSPGSPVSAGTEVIFVNHSFPVPIDQLTDRDRIVRWCWQCLVQVETHEAAEWFAADGVRPYYPDHRRNNPYDLAYMRTPKPLDE